MIIFCTFLVIVLYDAVVFDDTAFNYWTEVRICTIKRMLKFKFSFYHKSRAKCPTNKRHCRVINSDVNSFDISRSTIGSPPHYQNSNINSHRMEYIIRLSAFRRIISMIWCCHTLESSIIGMRSCMMTRRKSDLNFRIIISNVIIQTLVMDAFTTRTH